MTKFKQWYVRNQDAITWFIIGWMLPSGIYSLSQGDLLWSAIQFTIAGTNYFLRRIQLK